MRKKARMFRSLMLESLECRTVFSVDSLDAWQCTHDSDQFEFDRVETRQLGHNEHSTIKDGASGSRQRQSPQSSHRKLHDGYVDSLPEGEGFTFNRPTPDRTIADVNSNTSPRSNTQLSPARFDPINPAQVNPAQVNPAPQSSEPRVVIVINTTSNPTTFSRPRDNSLPNVPQSQANLAQLNLAQLNSGTLNSSTTVGNQPTGFASDNNSRTRSLNFSQQSSSFALPSILNGNSVAQTNLSSLSQSSISTGTTTFDFSLRPNSQIDRTAALSPINQRAGEFQFKKPQVVASGSIFDPGLVERTVGVASLENLLSDLAENHRRSRIENGADANPSHSKSEKVLRPEHVASSEHAVFADGDMIALALNRDVLSEFEDNSEVAGIENKAWVANVGIFRAFETGAVAATEYAPMTNRVSRTSESKSLDEDLPEVEAEVANAQLRPLLASTSALLGVIMFGLRRIRKSAPLMMHANRKP